MVEGKYMYKAACVLFCINIFEKGINQPHLSNSAFGKYQFRLFFSLGTTTNMREGNV